jgi:hypothetical protein
MAGLLVHVLKIYWREGIAARVEARGRGCHLRKRVEGVMETRGGIRGIEYVREIKKR